MNSLSTLIPSGLIPAGLLADPPPAFAFELSETGIAFARVGGTPQVQFQPFSAPLISVSPVRDNIHDAEGLAACIFGLLPPGGARKKRREGAQKAPGLRGRGNSIHLLPSKR